MKYSSLTDEQKLSLTSEEFLTLVKLEGIDRGIKPPITLENALKQSGAPGFSMPPDAMFFYEVCVPQAYGEPKATGICFKTLEQANRAIEGAFGTYTDGYGASEKKKLSTSDNFAVRQIWLSAASPKQYWAKFEEFFQDDTAFEKLCEECRDDVVKIRQAAYDKAVTMQKLKEYLLLAKNDVEIARAFWAKTERTEFPIIEA